MVRNTTLPNPSQSPIVSIEVESILEKACDVISTCPCENGCTKCQRLFLMEHGTFLIMKSGRLCQSRLQGIQRSIVQAGGDDHSERTART